MIGGGKNKTSDHVECMEIIHASIKQAKKNYEITERILLPSLITEVSDLFVVPLLIGEPNFITNKIISEHAVRISGKDVDPEIIDTLEVEQGKELEPEDLLKFGLIPEFVGRLPVLATLEDLDQDALVIILTQPKNALVKQYQRLFDLEDTQLTFTDEALQAIAKRAIERKTGARGLRSILEEILLDTMFDLPSMENVDEIVVNEEAVTTKAGPLVIYGDAQREPASAG